MIFWLLDFAIGYERFKNKDQRFLILEVGFCDLNLEFEIYDLGLLKPHRDEMIIENKTTTNQTRVGVTC